MANTKQHTLKDWIMATRPWSFPASAMPVLVTLGYLFWRGYELNWAIGAFTILNVILFHAAGNTWSDYKDYKNGVDREDTVGGISIVSGQFRAEEIKRLSFILLVTASCMGLGLVAFTGPFTLAFGLAGMVLTVLYPWLKYRALGDLDIFATYSLLPILGTTFVATGAIVPEALILSVPVGLITVGILHSNNTRDIEQDSRAGIRTFAMRLGPKRSIWVYCFEVLFPFAWVIASILLKLLPYWSALSLLALAMALGNARQTTKYSQDGMKALVGIDEKTAQLQLIFSVLMFISFIVGGIV